MTETATHTSPAPTDTAASLVHGYCPACNPHPQPGMILNAMCGTPKLYLGPISTDVPIGCAVCDALAGCPTCGWPNA